VEHIGPYATEAGRSRCGHEGRREPARGGPWASSQHARDLDEVVVALAFGSRRSESVAGADIRSPIGARAGSRAADCWPGPAHAILSV